MIGRRTIIGLCAVCALFVSAFAAQGAAAITKGTTVFTCSSSAAVKDFKTSHCKEGESGTAFGHIAVTEGTATTFKATNANTNAETNGPTSAKLKSTIAGSEFQLVATGVEATGTLENTKEATGEHMVIGKGIVIKYTGVTESLLGCSVEGTKPAGTATPGTIETYALTATTTGKGDAIEFKPEVGNLFAEFDLFKPAASCPFATGEPVFKVIGSIICSPDQAEPPVKPSGTTLTCSHEKVTGQGKLRIGGEAGPKAGYDGKVTLNAGTKKESEEGKTTPLSVTTVETA